MREIFAKFGDIESVETGFSGFCFVSFNDDRDADDAIQEMDNGKFAGRKINVHLATERGYQVCMLVAGALDNACSPQHLMFPFATPATPEDLHFPRTLCPSGRTCATARAA